MTNLHTEIYKNYKITVNYDDFVYYRDVVEQTGDNVQLHCDTRSLQLGDKDFAPKNYTLRQVIDNMPVDRLFVGDYGEHSDVWLSKYQEVTDQEIDRFINEIVESKSDEYTDSDECRDYVLDEFTLYDVVSNKYDITIICKKDTPDDEVENHWDMANDYVRGYCYLLTIDEPKKCETCNHVEWETVETNSFIGDYGVEIERAREIINSY